jgi:aromatic-L-amino-acid decarboxylase
LNLVRFRHRAGDGATQAVMDRVNSSGRAFLSHTRLRDRLALRACVGQSNSEERHVRALWGLIRDAARMCD